VHSLTLALATAVELAAFGICLYIVWLLSADAFLLVVHLRKAGRWIAEEADMVAQGSEPLVSIHLPIFNEGTTVGVTIDALANLDWPRDRLQILVLDDSTDQTTDIIRERVTTWRARGVDIAHVVRAHRQEFKAGALAAAFDQTDAPYIVVFDADYRPNPGFLRSTMAVLLQHPRAAFVQARLDYRNRNANLLTRAQALELDTFQAYEQEARNAAGVPTTFNGTCGVWRREAIDQAGGWRGRSLVEDQDLSYRAFACGWNCVNLITVAVEGELPEHFRPLAVQRARWGAGTAQAFFDMPWRLLGHLRWHQGAVFVLMQKFYASIGLLIGIALGLAVTSYCIDPERGTGNLIAFGIALYLLIVLKSAGALLATRLLGRPIRWGFLGDLVAMWFLQLFLLPVVASSLLLGALSRRLAFARTPKSGK
jgi:cellulose synthase/poly-beta-1,6-N-acetylglucosamine synthase-like glycosyltransferase